MPSVSFGTRAVNDGLQSWRTCPLVFSLLFAANQNKLISFVFCLPVVAQLVCTPPALPLDVNYNVSCNNDRDVTNLEPNVGARLVYSIS
jgi:hypothetical protein